MRKKFFIIILLFVFAFGFWQVKKAEFVRMNFVFIAKTVAVVSLEPKRNLALFELPDNLYLELPHGFGYYQLGSVYELGELEDRGAKLLEETMQNYLGAPIDGYIKLSNCSIAQLSNCLLLSLLGRGETSLNRWQIFKFWWEIKRLRFDKVKSIVLAETNILKKESLADGSEVLATEFFRLDELVKKYFDDSEIKKEAIKIEILNATNYPGLANQLARLVTNMGGEVISVSNSSIKYQVSSIKYQNESIKKTYTVRKLEKILKVKAEVGEIGESRADLVIFVGEDYSKRI